MAYEAFAEAERSGWADDARAAAYADLFAPVSDQLISPVMAAVDAAPGRAVLDLCCGHGNLTAALQDAGAIVTGVDFSRAMIARARSRVPEAIFVEADAADLPFEDGAFDAVACNVGLGHLPNPAAALAEIARVLRPGGIAALTTWREPEASPTFQIIFGAVKTHGDTSLAPPSPDFHLLARRGPGAEALAAAGLSAPAFSDLDAAFVFRDPAGFAEVFERATVRAAMLIEAQSTPARAAIRAAMTDRVRTEFGAGDGIWRVPFPATLVTARRGQV
jgi:SAM-dependent methyltransferase